MKLRTWWQRPKRLRDREIHRRVSFLELFYDLVYVVLIAEFAHALSGHVDPAHMGKFVFMFILVWIAWVNGTMYHELHGNEDLRTRFFTFAQMFTVAGMAVFAHNAISDGATGFALCFAAYQLILTWLWWRTGIHDPDHRPLSNPYSFAFLLSTALFAGSVFSPESWRFLMWGAACLISIVIPILLLGLSHKNQAAQEQLNRSAKIHDSAIERFGLLMIIVLGEIIASVVRGVTGIHHITVEVALGALLGMLIAIGLWWIYFDFISRQKPRESRATSFGWLYMHLPITLGVVAAGAGIVNAIEYADSIIPVYGRHLLSGSIGLTLICIFLLMQILHIPKEYKHTYTWGSIITIVSGVFLSAVGFISIQTVLFLAILVGILLVPVFFSAMVWIKLSLKKMASVQANN